jgi:hypothetical protein
MDDIHVDRLNGWSIATARGATGRFVSWAKMGMIQRDSPITEPGAHVWFEFGETRSEAPNKLRAELGLPLATSTI